MGLLDGTTQKEYYQGNNHGNYQFTSLDDIITQFQIMYVGEDKLIPKAKRADIAFHAQRALAELSFDTFKSLKSQEIDVPPSLTMILPHDYVNYTKVSRVDTAGVKHVLYPTKHTSNPFEIKQLDTGEYDFPEEDNLILNSGFDNDLLHYQFSAGKIDPSSGVLTFKHSASVDADSNIEGKSLAVWQEIDVSDVDFVNISADGVANASAPSGILRLGLSLSQGDYNTNSYVLSGSLGNDVPASTNTGTDVFITDTFLEWNGVSSTQTLSNVDVSAYDTIYVLITSNMPYTSISQSAAQNTIDNLSITNALISGSLSHANSDGVNSSTWTNFKSATPAEDSLDDYRYERHWLNPNERYGLDPSHAQINGSFYIDERLGKIHFSSNISGKIVILDYISDSLGTDAEMKVPKLAEDAMYKHMLYDLVSTRSNISGSRLNFHKKEKFAAVRKAKLRLSNIKLEELTQILRGQSKHIKH